MPEETPLRPPDDILSGGNTIVNEGPTLPEVTGTIQNDTQYPVDMVVNTEGDYTVDSGMGLIYSRFGQNSPWVMIAELRETREGSVMRVGHNRTYVRRFLVRVNRNDLGATNVCGAPGIPRLYSFYVTTVGVEYDYSAVCVDISAAMQVPGDRRNWIVTCTYSTEIAENGPDYRQKNPRIVFGSQHDPTLRPPKIRWDEEEIQRAPQRDLDGRPYTTSARQPFSPPPTFPVAVPVLVMERVESAFGQRTISEFSHALNADAFLGRKPGQVQCMPPRGEQIWVGNKLYWKVTWRFRFSPPKPKNETGTTGFFDILAQNAFQEQEIVEYESWQPEILDQGTMRIQNFPGAPLFGQPVNHFVNGHAVTNPVLLDGNGQVRQKDANGYIQPTFLRFRQFQTKRFNLIFGNSLLEIDP